MITQIYSHQKYLSNSMDWTEEYITITPVRIIVRFCSFWKEHRERHYCYWSHKNEKVYPR